MDRNSSLSNGAFSITSELCIAEIMKGRIAIKTTTSCSFVVLLIRIDIACKTIGSSVAENLAITKSKLFTKMSFGKVDIIGAGNLRNCCTTLGLSSFNLSKSVWLNQAN